jgi:homoaconitase/3-isopropylmalate dehydratase large subunit
MKHSGHHEGMVHLVATLGFFLLAGFLLLAPDNITTHGALGIMAFMLGLKTVGNLIMDAHNKVISKKK